MEARRPRGTVKPKVVRRRVEEEVWRACAGGAVLAHGQRVPQGPRERVLEGHGGGERALGEWLEV